MMTYNKNIVDTLKFLKEEFEQVDGRGFKVYYKKVIVPTNTTQTDMNEVWSSLHWPVSESTSYPDFCSPWPFYEHEGDTEPSFRVHFVLSGENITNGWKALQTPIKHTIELLRLRRYDPDNIPDSDTFLDNFPKSEKEPVDDLHTNIWYEFLLKLSQENDCDISYESIKDIPFSELPCTVDIEGLKTDALKASILALDYLLGEAEQKYQQTETGQDTTPAKKEKDKSKTIGSVNIQNFHGILGDVQAENVQTGNHASIHKETKAEKKNKGRAKKVWQIVLGIVTFLAALLGIFSYLGWLEPIRTFIYNILQLK